MPTSGWDLKVARIRANLSKTAVAARMGTSRQTLWVHERSATVDPEFAQRYLQAVADLADAKETPSGEAA